MNDASLFNDRSEPLDAMEQRSPVSPKSSPYFTDQSTENALGTTQGNFDRTSTGRDKTASGRFCFPVSIGLVHHEVYNEHRPDHCLANARDFHTGHDMLLMDCVEWLVTKGSIVQRSTSIGPTWSWCVDSGFRDTKNFRFVVAYGDVDRLPRIVNDEVQELCQIDCDIPKIDEWLQEEACLTTESTWKNRAWRLEILPEFDALTFQLCSKGRKIEVQGVMEETASDGRTSIFPEERGASVRFTGIHDTHIQALRERLCEGRDLEKQQTAGGNLTEERTLAVSTREALEAELATLTIPVLCDV